MPARLRGWDYGSVGAYFVTVCTHNRRPVLAAIDGGQSMLTPLGMSVLSQLQANSEATGVSLQHHVVMPDHLHFIVRIQPESGSTTAVDVFVARFKADATRVARTMAFLAPDRPLWQRGFFDRVIRSEEEFIALVDYVATNPLRWTISANDLPREP
jgi:putative transposase